MIMAQGYSIAREDLERPWGGFLALDEKDATEFVTKYFPEIILDTTAIITPKFLLIAPGKRLSWQYHDRRSECWRVIHGRVGVMRSLTDDMPKHMIEHEKGEMIMLECKERHRLIGLEEWAVVAEIWVHNNVMHPSDESDIVRVQDDFQRD